VPEVLAFAESREQLRDTIAKRCIDDRWSQAAADCFMAATVLDDAWACASQLDDKQRAALDRDRDKTIALTAPPSTTKVAAPGPRTLVIEVRDNDQLFIAGQAITSGELDAIFRKAPHDTQVVVKKSALASRAAVIDAIDRGKAAGLSDFAIATETM
jgi:biopolymer transport protein ExbD